MGIKRFSGSDGYFDRNPDPSKYTIINNYTYNQYTILRVQYTGCTNFEGMKILVFEGPATIIGRGLDPHFFESSNLIARFLPTNEGMEMAFKFCRAMAGE